MIVTTNKAAMISHSRVPLRLSGSMPKTTSIQSLCTKVITNRILVAMATPVSSQKRHLNALPEVHLAFHIRWLIAPKTHHETQLRKCY